MNKLTPIILAGGTGKRLWPVSRQSMPKQFSKFFGQYSLFQETIRRLYSPTSSCIETPIIISSEQYRFIVSEQLDEIGVDDFHLIIEPSGKDSAASVISACYWLKEFTDKDWVCVLPADHDIKDSNAFINSFIKLVNV